MKFIGMVRRNRPGGEITRRYEGGILPWLLLGCG